MAMRQCKCEGHTEGHIVGEAIQFADLHRIRGHWNREIQQSLSVRVGKRRPLPERQALRAESKTIAEERRNNPEPPTAEPVKCLKPDGTEEPCENRHTGAAHGRCQSINVAHGQCLTDEQQELSEQLARESKRLVD